MKSKKKILIELRSINEKLDALNFGIEGVKEILDEIIDGSDTETEQEEKSEGTVTDMP